MSEWMVAECLAIQGLQGHSADFQMSTNLPPSTMSTDLEPDQALDEHNARKRGRKC